MFEGFRKLDLATADVEFSGVIGGNGPAVLMLHGYPQTHLTWRRVAPALLDSYTLVIPDLPGYGNSRIVAESGPRWTKRRVAAATVGLMDRLGHADFAVVGHDRGARVGYRLAFDFPERVRGYASLTVIPTLDAFAGVDAAFALNAFHWFMLAQPDGLPERLLSADPVSFIDAALAHMAGSLDRFEPEVLQAYRSAFRNPAVRHAICEDYRSAAYEDREHDAADRAAGRTLSCPVSVLWPEREGATGPTPLDTWRRWAADVRGCAVEGGHLLPEFSATAVVEHLTAFLSDVTG